MQENIELMGNIVRGIISDEEYLEGNVDFSWVEFSFVFSVNEEGELSGNFGYAYDAKGAYYPTSIDTFAIEASVIQYRDWLAKDTGEGFKKMLLQFNRDSGRVQADFEYDDPMRWKVTPNNIDQMIEDLRPNLGG